MLAVHVRNHRAIVAMSLAFASACAADPLAGIGDTCAEHADCEVGAQCLDMICRPLCSAHRDCGPGHLCTAEGQCERVTSLIGDPCERELDCGPGQRCQLDAADTDGDGSLAASCQLEAGHISTGAACQIDSECTSGICSLGRCSEVCAVDDDCPLSLACVDIPHSTAAALFRGCLQSGGRLSVTHRLTSSAQTIRVVVPGNAHSFAMVARVDDPNEIVGATRVVDPNGEDLYRAPTEGSGAIETLRYSPEREISTLLLPNSPSIQLLRGIYAIDVRSMTARGNTGSAIPRVDVIYKLGGPGSVLDLNFYFLDLSAHPCDSALDGAVDARGARDSAAFQQVYLPALAGLLAQAGIAIGNVTYSDVRARADLDILQARDLGALMALSNTESGVNIFFARAIDPVGVQALAGGSPGAPGIPRTPSSGVALSAETLCYRGWDQVARTTMHIVSRQLGLFRNIDPDGRLDPIADSDDSSDNLMFFSELAAEGFAGTRLSTGQGTTLRRNPVLR